MTGYRTVQGPGQAEYEIERSKFISQVGRAESVDAAAAFVAAVKQRQGDATHNCSAWIIGQGGRWQRADDDGEPSGTAGKPILEVIGRSGLIDTVIVVTRYFGGIKLGAGGLIRAYSRAAVLGIEAAGLVSRVAHVRLSVCIDYGDLGKVQTGLKRLGHLIESIDYGATVTLQVLAREDAAPLVAELADWTAGMARVQPAGEAYIDVPIGAG